MSDHPRHCCSGTHNLGDLVEMEGSNVKRTDGDTDTACTPILSTECRERDLSIRTFQPNERWLISTTDAACSVSECAANAVADGTCCDGGHNSGNQVVVSERNVRISSLDNGCKPLGAGNCINDTWTETNVTCGTT